MLKRGENSHKNYTAQPILNFARSHTCTLPLTFMSFYAVFLLIHNIMISSLIVIPAYILEAKLNVIKQDYCPKFLLHN